MGKMKALVKEYEQDPPEWEEIEDEHGVIICDCRMCRARRAAKESADAAR